MFEHWKKDWKALEKAPVGHRFVQHHESRKRDGGGGWKRIVTIAVGLALIVAGIIMLAIPGPGLLAIAFGGALVAQEFRWAAVALDWAEVALRKAAHQASRFWKSASPPLRGFVLACGAAMAAGGAYIAWTWLAR